MPKKKKIIPTQAIHGYLLTHGSISRTTAITHFEVYDLPQVMSRLKRNGVSFKKSGTGKHLKYTIPEVAAKYRNKSTKVSKVEKSTYGLHQLPDFADSLQPQS